MFTCLKFKETEDEALRVEQLASIQTHLELWCKSPAVSAPSKNCDEEGGKGGEEEGKGSGDLLNINIDLSLLGGLGQLLKDLLKSLIDLLTRLLGGSKGGSEMSECECKDMAEKLEGLVIAIMAEIDLLGIRIKLKLMITLGLGGMLDKVLDLVDCLLSGDLDGVVELLNEVIGLVINLLKGLGITLEVNLALQLLKILDLSALLKL